MLPLPKIEINEASVKSEKRIVSVQIPYEIYEFLKREAEEDFISISDVTRRILVRYYRDNTTK